MPLDYLAFLRDESARFAAVLADADPAAPVPSCPDWTAADLLWHLAEVQLFWGAIVRDRLPDPDAAEAGRPERPGDYAALRALFDDASARLIQTLEQTPSDTPIWTWADGEDTVAFVHRRQAHEALIHRLDAELAAGIAPGDVDARLATDGVQEVFDWMYSGSPAWADRRVDGPVGRVTTTDTGAQWLVRIGHWSGHSPNSGKDYTDEKLLVIVEDGDPVFTLTGSARDLDAWLWNRPAVGSVELSGDAAEFQAVLSEGVQ
jgi:uncharacterized protein (TIGR03083 family)